MSGGAGNANMRCNCFCRSKDLSGVKATSTSLSSFVVSQGSVACRVLLAAKTKALSIC